MSEPAIIISLTISTKQRIISISDIHGNIDMLVALLEKSELSDDDILILLGDFYTKGPKGKETIEYIIKLCQRSSVYAVRGNTDIIADDMTQIEKEWLESLPHIIETEEYTFVHGGLTSHDLTKQTAWECMKNDAFMDKDLAFDKYIITGHWPVNNYCHKVPCLNPIVNEEKRIVAIDGGTINRGGQLNAFIIRGGEFSFESVDLLPKYIVKKSQLKSGGTLNITWHDRFVELVEQGEEFSVYRHTATGKTLSIANTFVWADDEGNTCAVLVTDYYLPVSKGDIVSVVERFSDRIFAKKDGIMGWVRL